MKIKSNPIFLHLLLVTASIILFTACYKKDFSELKLANANPEYLYPLIDAQLSLKDIVDPTKKKLNIIEDSNGFYTFIYYEDIFDQYITDYLKIKDVSTSQTVSLTNAEVNTLPVSKTVTHTFSNSYSLVTGNGEQLKHINIKSGVMPFNISSTFKHSIELTVTFPYIKKNNVPLTQTILLSYKGSSPVVSDNQIDLSGYTIDFSENGTKVNTVSYTASMKVTYQAGNGINTGQKLTFATGIKNIEYYYIDGYIGKYNITIPQDTVSIDLFNSAYAGNVFFTDPKVRAIIGNSIGAESSLKINQLFSSSNISGSTTITGSNINTTIPIAYPNQNELGQTKSTTIQLDKNNSNVQTVFNPAPDKIFYQMSAMINPSGVTMNYVTDQSKISVRGEVEIPMEGKIKTFVLLDTLEDISYPKMEISGSDVTVIHAGFNVALRNGFPMNASLQMYFLDDNNNVVDSLFKHPHLIPSGNIDGDGKVISPNYVLIHEVFDEKRYKKVTSSTKAVMYAYFSTANDGSVPVKIYSSYKIKSNISIDIKANVSF